MYKCFFLSALAIFSIQATAQTLHHNCFVQAGDLYKVDYRLLKAIGIVESGLRTNAVNSNSNKSEDVGIMQINSFWFPKLSQFGIDRTKLMTDACVNIHVGAWILAQNMRQLGNTWNAVGAYNARNPEKRVIYVNKVWRQYETITAYDLTKNKTDAENNIKSKTESSIIISTPSKLRII
jgi:soluble lytic murein transglycosylase-like protein